MKRKFFLYSCAIILTVITAFIVWALNSSKAEPEPLELALHAPDLQYTEGNQYIALIQKGMLSKTGIIYYPGAKVDPHSYVAKLTELVQAIGVNIYITKPPLNLAIFSIEAADRIISENPSITTWYIAGHSLGGAMACLYTEKHTDTVSGLFLFGSYCTNDLRNYRGKIVSISGRLDALSTMEKVNAYKSNLPSSAEVYFIDGANHSQMGDYFLQKGDAVATANDSEVTQKFISYLRPILLR